MSPCCGKIPDEDDVRHIIESIEAHGSGFQGDIGEHIAAEVATEQLNLTAEFFDPPHNGFDSVYRDSAGKLVVVEAKFTKGGMSSLGGTIHGTQGSVEWVEYNAELMCDPLSSRYSPDNAKIGAEILRVGAENVHVVVIHTNPGTLESTVHHIR